MFVYVCECCVCLRMIVFDSVHVNYCECVRMVVYVCVWLCMCVYVSPCLCMRAASAWLCMIAYVCMFVDDCG